MLPEVVVRIRVAVLAIFLAGMPVLALPQVNDWLGRRLFGDVAPAAAQAEGRSEPRSIADRADAPSPGPSTARHDKTDKAASGPISPSTLAARESGSGPKVSGPKVLGPAGSSPAGSSRSVVGETVSSQTEQAAAIERLPPAEFEVAGAKYGRLQSRLRELGADYWRLETTGAGASAFRFECHLPLPDHESYSRPFASESTDPLDAMERVVAQVEKQVEKWQAAQAARRAGGSVRR